MIKTTNMFWLAISGISLFALFGCGGSGGGGGSSDGDNNAGQVQTHTVTTDLGPNGAISPDIQTVNHGETASFMLLPDSGYTIEEATGCNGILNGTSYTTGAITTSCTVSVSFTPISYTLTSTANTGGSITPTSKTVAFGDTVNFEVLTDTGYNIASISGCNGTLRDTTYTTAPATDNCSVSVTFTEGIQLPLYNILISAEPSYGGSISGGGSYSEGMLVNVSAIPATGFRFDNWVENGVTVSSSPDYSFITTKERQLIANFSPETYTVITSASIGGLISPPSKSVSYGEIATFTLTPDEGYSIQSITGCYGSLAGNIYSTGPVTNDCEVSVIFSRYPVLKFNEGLLNGSSLG